MSRPAALLPYSFVAIAMLASCAYFFPSCQGVPPCPTGTVLCNNLSCSDLRHDEFNCGFCNNACGAGLACAGLADGGAACGCPIAGQQLLEGRCLDFSIDPANCGAPGNACRFDQACLDGGCGCPSPAYLDGGGLECPSDAGPRCTNLIGDALNCGACGHACAEGACVAGLCTDAGFVDAGATLDGGVLDGGTADAGDAVADAGPGDGGAVADAGSGDGGGVGADGGDGG